MQKLEDVTIVVIKYKGNISRGVGRILKKAKSSNCAKIWGRSRDVTVTNRICVFILGLLNKALNSLSYYINSRARGDS